MVNMVKGQRAFVARRKGQGIETFEGKVDSVGPKWIKVTYEVRGGVTMTDLFDVKTRCLKNFGDVKKVYTLAELPDLMQEA